jgi:hypothetical protein
LGGLVKHAGITYGLQRNTAAQTLPGIVFVMTYYVFNEGLVFM